MLSINEIKKIAQAGPFQPNWSSLQQFQMPIWFQQAKFGIFVHWGLYSVPAFNNEWYSRNMYIKDSPEYLHHRQTFGMQDEFGYQDFIPLFTAEKFNADAWGKLFKETGAEYVFPVAEHHDGFQMYQSELSDFNSFKMGPKKDILGELKTAFQKLDLHFCTSSHRAEHWFFMGHGKEFPSDVHEPLKKGDFYWPAQTEPDNQDLFSHPYPTQEYLDDWLQRTVEIIENYQPEILYFDWWIQHDAFKEYLQILTAFYYNRGLSWGKKVAICYKHDALMFGCGIVEIERGKFKDAQPFYWQTDTAIAHNSWSYTTNLQYKTPKEIIQTLIEAVSKNGNLLLNVGPKADGSFATEDLQIMKTIGEWLKINGSGIYHSKCWRKAGEGPTEILEGKFSEGQGEYVVGDIRYTVAEECIFAFVMAPFLENHFILKNLRVMQNPNSATFHGIIEEVVSLDSQVEILRWDNQEDGLHIETKKITQDLPITFKIKVK
ncbi:alpha-L-fucosidase [Enterococcus timonensis]|uniref:alpha-L-fucosidase n=1 Tax=Enterococcus timonensis TaxID=1852364 RepID=UPI0008DA9694|nr:alpha-L-fucosidase [Enterococcus timonensis]